MIVSTLAFSSGRTSAPAEKVQLAFATMHAAALTTPRTGGDTTDSPFLVVSVTGPRSSRADVFPHDGPLTIRHDQALGARPLTELTLADGDSVQVHVAVLEYPGVQGVDAEDMGARSIKKRARSTEESVEQVTELVAPLVKKGAYSIGSATLLLTNESGAIHWRRLDCLSSCAVLSAPATKAMPSIGAEPLSGVVELTGNGGIYHLVLRADRAP